MKKHIARFFQRGLIAAGFGPLVLAIIYGIIAATGTVDSLSPTSVCKGIVTIYFMAFIAGGINEVYQIERVPLPFAIGIHALVLYMDYLMIYLVNGWLQKQITPIFVFTGIFVGGFGLIWLVIYAITKHRTQKINENLPL